MDNDKDREDADRLQRALLNKDDEFPLWKTDVAPIALILLFIVLGFVLVEIIK